jgi:hypothetical protein
VRAFDHLLDPLETLGQDPDPGALASGWLT